MIIHYHESLIQVKQGMLVSAVLVGYGSERKPAS